MYRSAILRQTRYFSTTPRFQKSAIDVGKDALNKVNRVVSDKLVGAIETGENVAQKTKETVGTDASEVKANANEAVGTAKGKASELTGEAKGKASELSGKAKGAAEEAKAKAS
ncbi:hypothetical protein EG328_001564 [Venturia inaequalis]|uniref:Lea domain protein n=1 Tax=Venturia inaequalis TaxID=5025 RepID=A0A8H3VKM7_VENIN|nr:hypothetical protein EG328_001564 [Venturia inaequalis]KAE9990914.1 hypothetical protein EG327_000746 [Venturia inaequalis]RDI77440.1 hypothetical protein Vi05172_g12580 [Venturia inaequalis]